MAFADTLQPSPDFPSAAMLKRPIPCTTYILTQTFKMQISVDL